MEHKVVKLKSSQEKMTALFKELKACQDSQKAAKIEARLTKLINKNVALVYEK